MIADALKLSVYFGEAFVPADDALMRCFERHGVRCAALMRGIEGFGINRRIHAERFPDSSTDLPLLAWAVDTEARIRGLLGDVDRIVPRGLVTLERARLATGGDVARVEFPGGVGKAAKLTIYCASRAPYREAVSLLREEGASGAIVLPGVDGLVDGRRRRARLFGVNGGTPMVIISVGPVEPLLRALRRLGDVLPGPTVTVERIAQVKHDGELLEEPLTADGPDVWQTIRIYTRRAAQVNGRALYSEVTRALRLGGGAGATTILGDWCFSSDEPPHGDRFGRITSHRPTYTVYIDRPRQVAQLWPVIDALTAEHGIVTSLLVPGYRERAGTRVNGTLEW